MCDYSTVYVGEVYSDGGRDCQVVHDDRAGAEEDIAVLAGFDGRHALAWEYDGDGRSETASEGTYLVVTVRHVFTGSPDPDSQHAETNRGP